MVAHTIFGAEAPGPVTPERPEKDDARELGGGAGIKVQARTYNNDSRSDAPASPVCLAWEAELDANAIKPAPSREERVYAAWWEFDEATAALVALGERPLLLGGKRRRHKRRADADSDPSRPFGAFPKRRDTVIAEALARLLEGEKLTGMDGVFDCNTTRFADQVHELRHRHGWCIESSDVQVRTNDGRSVPVAEYWLTPEVREAAAAAGGAEFCSEVRAARAELRASARGRG